MARLWRNVWLLGVDLLVLGALASCSEELGEDRPPTTKVVGKVVDAGRPVSGGWIEFIPVEGTLGSSRSTVLRSDGAFEALGVPIGRVGVGFTAVKTSRTDPRRFDSLGTPIRRTISPGADKPLVIDLFDERIQDQARTGR